MLARCHDDRYLKLVANEVAVDFSGKIVVGEDLTELEI
jgi:hypothetical protein